VEADRLTTASHDEDVAGDDHPQETLQSQLSGGPDGPAGDQQPGPADGETPPPITDPVALLHDLETSGRFHRDTGFGRLFHPGSISFRENRPNDSLHIVVHDDRIAAHVDRVSPLGTRAGGSIRYSLRRAATHNLVGMAQDTVQLLRGRQGDHRSELDCEWLWEPGRGVPDASDLLDPEASAWSVHFEARVAGSLDVARSSAATTSAWTGSATSCSASP